MLSELREKAEALGIKVDGRWSEKRLREEIEKVRPEEAVEKAIEKAVEEAAISPSNDDDMNALALRIWQGQSASLPLRTRVERICERLKAKGYDPKGLKLPAEGYEKYL